MKVPFTKNIHNLFQGLPNPGFRSVKVQTETFLIKDSQDFKNSFFRVPMNPYQAWKAKLESALFWVFIIVKNQCAKHPLEFEGRFVNLFGNFSPLCALS